MHHVKYATIAAWAMVLIEMVYEGLWGVGFWAPPVLISGVFFPEIAVTFPPIGFLLVPFILGLVIHKVTGFVFSVILSRLYRKFNINSPRTSMILGGVYGAIIFAVSWFVVLPFVNPALLMLEPSVFAVTHIVFGMILGRYIIKPEA